MILILSTSVRISLLKCAFCSFLNTIFFYLSLQIILIRHHQLCSDVIHVIRKTELQAYRVTDVRATHDNNKNNNQE